MDEERGDQYYRIEYLLDRYSDAPEDPSLMRFEYEEKLEEEARHDLCSFYLDELPSNLSALESWKSEKEGQEYFSRLGALLCKDTPIKTIISEYGYCYYDLKIIGITASAMKNLGADIVEIVKMNYDVDCLLDAEINANILKENNIPLQTLCSAYSKDELMTLGYKEEEYEQCKGMEPTFVIDKERIHKFEDENKHEEASEERKLRKERREKLLELRRHRQAAKGKTQSNVENKTIVPEKIVEKRDELAEMIDYYANAVYESVGFLLDCGIKMREVRHGNCSPDRLRKADVSLLSIMRLEYSVDDLLKSNINAGELKKNDVALQSFCDHYTKDELNSLGYTEEEYGGLECRNEICLGVKDRRTRIQKLKKRL